jgi:hypothetical protein
MIETFNQQAKLPQKVALRPQIIHGCGLPATSSTKIVILAADSTRG